MLKLIKKYKVQRSIPCNKKYRLYLYMFKRKLIATTVGKDDHENELVDGLKQCTNGDTRGVVCC